MPKCVRNWHLSQRYIEIDGLKRRGLLWKAANTRKEKLTLEAIASFCSLRSMSFGQAVGKLQGKVVTHSGEVGWWRNSYRFLS